MTIGDDAMCLFKKKFFFKLPYEIVWSSVKEA